MSCSGQSQVPFIALHCAAMPGQRFAFGVADLAQAASVITALCPCTLNFRPAGRLPQSGARAKDRAIAFGNIFKDLFAISTALVDYQSILK